METNRPHEILVISTYPPRSCGLATYAHDVVHGVTAAGVPCRVLAIDAADAPRSDAPEVWRYLAFDDQTGYTSIAQDIVGAGFSAIAVQHEFGLFGGDDGDWLLDLYSNVTIPIVTTLHTVLPEPSSNQRRIIVDIAAKSHRLIVLSEISRALLAERYGIDENVVVIPHGVPDVPFTETSTAKIAFGHGLAGRPTISTFGLIGRGKGIEFAIEALRRVRDAIPDVLYVVAGRTHPGVIRHEGESYRRELQQLVKDYGLVDNVLFLDQFLSLPGLLGLLAASDVYFTPYTNPNQVVSGTLAYAMGLGKAILSTPYKYALELLAQDRGFICGFGDCADMAAKLTMLLRDTELRTRIELQAYAYGRGMTWPYVSGLMAQIYTDCPTPDRFLLGAHIERP